MHSLPLFFRLDGRPVILIGEGEAALAKRRLIEQAGGRVVSEADEDARLAFIALEGDSAEAAAARLKARGLLVNVVDRPDLCDFTTPAIIDRDPVIVAVGTGGASAGLAASLRQRIEALLPARLGDLARGLFAARDWMRDIWPGAAERRRALGEALAPGGMIDPLGGIYDVGEWLKSRHDRPLALLYSLHLSSPDPDHLTLQDARMLAQADRILYPPGTPVAVLARARADAVRMLDKQADLDLGTLRGITVRINITRL